MAETLAKLSAKHKGVKKSPYKILVAEIDARHLSYFRLAKIFDVAPQNISRKMLGQRNFTERDKAKFVEIFGKPIEYLMFKEEILC